MYSSMASMAGMALHPTVPRQGYGDGGQYVGKPQLFVSSLGGTDFLCVHNIGST